MLNSPWSFFFSFIIMRCLFGRIRWHFSKSNQQLDVCQLFEWSTRRVTSDSKPLRYPSVSSAAFSLCGNESHTCMSKILDRSQRSTFLFRHSLTAKNRAICGILLCTYTYMCKHSGVAMVWTNGFFCTFAIGYNVSSSQKYRDHYFITNLRLLTSNIFVNLIFALINLL